MYYVRVLNHFDARPSCPSGHGLIYAVHSEEIGTIVEIVTKVFFFMGNFVCLSIEW
jgi:hypothetical protein